MPKTVRTPSFYAHHTPSRTEFTECGIVYGLWGMLVGGTGLYILYGRWVVCQLQRLSYYSQNKMLAHQRFGIDEAMLRLLYLASKDHGYGVRLFEGAEAYRFTDAYANLLHKSNDDPHELSTSQIKDLVTTLEQHYQDVVAVTWCVGDMCPATLKERAADDCHVRGNLNDALTERHQVIAGAQAVRRCENEYEIKMLAEMARVAQIRGSAKEIVDELASCVKRVLQET